MSDELKLKMCFIARQIVGQVVSCTLTLKNHFAIYSLIFAFLKIYA